MPGDVTYRLQTQPDAVEAQVKSINKSLDKFTKKVDEVNAAFGRLNRREVKAAEFMTKFGSAAITSVSSLSTLRDESVRSAVEVGKLDIAFRDSKSSVLALSSAIDTSSISLMEATGRVKELRDMLEGISKQPVTLDVSVGKPEDVNKLAESVKKADIAVPMEADDIDIKATSDVFKKVLQKALVRVNPKALVFLIEKALKKVRPTVAAPVVAPVPAPAPAPAAPPAPAPAAPKATPNLQLEALLMAAAAAAAQFNEALVSIDDQIKDAKRSADDFVAEFEDGFSDMSKDAANVEKFVSAIFSKTQARALDDYIGKMTKAQKETFNLKYANKDLADIIKDLAATSPGFAGALNKANKTAEKSVQGLVEQFSRFGEETKKARGLVGQFNSRLQDGANQAKSFAGGIGTSNGMLIGMGVGAAFLATKLSGLLSEFKEAALTLSKFNVNTKLMETQLAAGGKSLNDMRKEIGLTKAQSEAFFEVVKTGVNTLGLSRAAIESAAKALQATFGGDPTARLKEYVDLLKEIPTIETDLQVGAEFDDQAAALFALAQKGKVEAAIEMQAAGLLGGVAPPPTSKDAELLNSAQKTEAAVESLKDSALKYYPTWGPQFTAIMDVGAKAITAIGAATAIFGAMGAFLGRGQFKDWRNDKEILAAVRAQRAGGGGGGPGGPGGTGWLDSIKNVFSGLGKSGGKLGKVFGSVSGIVGKVAKLPFGKIAGAATAITTVGYAASSLSSGLGTATDAVDTLTGSITSDLGTSATAVADNLKTVSDSAQTATSLLGKFGAKLATRAVMAGPLAWVSVAAEVLGAGLEYLGDKVQESGTTFGKLAGSAMKAEGAFLKFVGGVAAGAGVGALIGGPIGAAAGAVAGILLGVGSMWESTGEAIAVAGKSLQVEFVKGGQGIKKYNKYIVMGGKAMEWFGTKLASAGTYLKETLKNMGETIWDATKAVASAWWDFQKQIWSSIPIVKDVVNVISNLSVYSEEYRAELEKARKEMPLLTESWKKLEAANEKISKMMKTRNDMVMKSALALQKEMEALKNIVGSAKLALYDFRQGLASLQAENLADFGGSTAAFLSALGDQISNAEAKLNDLTQAFADRRKKIMEDATLQGEQRRQALENLSNEESKAIKGYLDTVKKVSAAMMKTPARALADAKAEIAKTKVAMRAESGTFTGEELLAGVNESLKEIRKAQAEASKAFAQSIETAETAEKKLAEVRTQKTKQVGDAFASMSEESKKAVSEAMGAKPGEMPDISVMTQEQIDSAAEKLKGMRTEWQKKVDEAAKGLTTPVLDMAKQVKATSDAAKAATERREKAEKEEAEMAKKGTSEADMKKYRDATAQSKDEEAKILEQRESQEKVLAERIRSMIGEEMSAAEASAVAAVVMGEIGKNGKTAEEALLAALPTYKAQGKTVAELATIIDKIATKTEDNRDGLLKWGHATKELTNIVPVTSAMDDVSKAADGQVLAMENQAAAWKNIQTLSEQYKETLKQINLNTAKEVVDQKRLVASAEAQAAVAGMSGDAIKETVDAISANGKLTMRQYEASQKTVKAYRDVLSTDEELLKMAEAKLAELIASGKKDTQAAQAVEENVITMRKNVSAAKDLIAEQEKVQKELVKQYGLIGDQIDATQKAVEDTVAGRKVDIEAALGDALMAFSQFSNNIEATTSEGFAYAEKAARERLALDKKAVDDAIEEEKRRIAGRVEKMMPGASTAEKERAVAEQTATLEAKKRTKYAEMESKQKQSVLDAAKKEAEARLEALNVTQEMLSAQQEIAETFDGSARAVAGYLQQGLAIEQDKLKVLEDEYARVKAEGTNTTAVRKVEAELVKQQATVRKKELENIKKMVDLRMQELEIRQSGIDAEIDFISEMGGNMSTILKLQGQTVSNEREKYELLKKQAEDAKAAGVTGKELLDLETKARVQWFNLQKKAVGIQKDVYEKMLGKIIGELRTSFGARRQRGTDVGLLGVKETRVKTRAGMFAEASEDMTIASRSIKRQMEDWKRGSSGLGEAPKRLKPEEEMAEVRKNTEKTAEDVGKLTDSATSKGSIYTADDVSHQYLKVIAEAASKTNINLVKLEKTTGQVALTATPGVRAATPAKVEAATGGMVEQFKAAEKELADAAAAMKAGGGPDAEARFKKAAVAVDSLSDSIRSWETSNPLAGSAAVIGKSFDDVMSDKPSKAVEEFAKKTSEASDESEKQGKVQAKNVKPSKQLAKTTKTLAGPKGFGAASTRSAFAAAGAASKALMKGDAASTFDPDAMAKATANEREAAANRLFTIQQSVAAEKKGAKTNALLSEDMASELTSVVGETQNAGKAIEGGIKTFGEAGYGFMTDKAKTPTAADVKGWEIANAKPLTETEMAIAKIQDASQNVEDAFAVTKMPMATTAPGMAKVPSAVAKAPGFEPPPATTTIAGGAGAAPGAGMGATAPMTASIKGEILVRFDNKIFKDQMAAVMGQLLMTPENRIAIQKQTLNS